MIDTINLGARDTEREVDLHTRKLLKRVMAGKGGKIGTAEDMDMAGKIRAGKGTKKAVEGFHENSQ